VEPAQNRAQDPLVIRRSEGGPLVDLAGFNESAQREEFLTGALQEHLRLLYVALTRARNRCYLLTGAVKGLESSALGWLLHGRAGETPPACRERLKAATWSGLRADLEALVAEAGGANFTVTPRLPKVGQAASLPAAPTGAKQAAEFNSATGRLAACPTLAPLGGDSVPGLRTAESLRQEAGEPEFNHGQEVPAAGAASISLSTTLPELATEALGWRESAGSLSAPRPYTRPAFPRWGIQSFSGLTANVPEEAPDHDAVELPATPSGPDAEAGAADEFARLPRGTGFGTCLHEVFEQIDFAAEPETWKPTVEAALRKHQLGDTTAEPVLRLIQEVLETSLTDAGGTFRLREVAVGQRLNELEFFLPLRGFTVGGLCRVFERHGGPMPEWPARLGALGFEEADGFLHGYVDLIFEHAGRFHLVDWKTNWLGTTAAAYTPETVARAMRSGFYVLQYHLYAVALRRYLRLRQPGTDFSELWGGVHYAFVRGADAQRPEQGWFRDRPAESLLDDLERALTGGESR
jgi:ATP-dependent exoDNAse (exonuclease V) beta subunit